MDWVADKFKFRLAALAREKGPRGFQVLLRRWVVESACGWLIGNRRLGKGYERLIEPSAVMNYNAVTRNILRKFARVETLRTAPNYIKESYG